MVSRLRLQSLSREAMLLGVMVLGILAARSSLADHYYVPTGSMENTLLVGDRVVVDKRAYGLRIPFSSMKLTDGVAVARGDVVIFDSPRDGKRLIKRIVATGGDRVVIDQGRLFINGQSLADPQNPGNELLGNKTALLNLNDGGGPDWHGTIKDGQLLAVGDHRGNSADGRMFGVVGEQDIYGRAVAVYYRRNAGFSWLRL